MELDHYRHIDGVHVHKEESDSSVMIAKATAMSVLFLASMSMGLLPIRLSKLFKWTQTSDVKAHTFVSLLLSFGGGVLLCTTFQHLLPEVNEGVLELQEDGRIPELKIHLGELLMCAGFFIIFLVEELVHLYLHRREKRSELENVFQRSLSIRRGEKLESPLEITTTVSTADLLKNQSNGTLNEIVIKPTANGNGFVSCPPKMNEHHHHHHMEPHNGHSHIVLPEIDDEDPFVSSLRGLMVVLALSVHELFEGLAVGLEKSTANVWYMFAAVSAHKLVIAFCVGVELVATKTKIVLTVLYVFVFAVVSPLGIGIGIGLSADENAGGVTEIASVVLQGLATGTLLYVVFFEVLRRERQGMKQYLAILFGFLFMFGLQYLTSSLEGEE